MAAILCRPQCIKDVDWRGISCMVVPKSLATEYKYLKLQLTNTLSYEAQNSYAHS